MIEYISRDGVGKTKIPLGSKNKMHQNNIKKTPAYDTLHIGLHSDKNNQVGI